MTCHRELWAAEQALLRLQRKLETLPGWRASMAWEAVESAINELMGQGMWDAHHAQSMPRRFRHWREKYADEEVL